MDGRRHCLATPRLAAAECARRIASIIEDSLADRARVTVAISGGTSPRLLFEQLTAATVPWDRVHIFWVDERAVPPVDPRSNYRLAAETLLRPARIPERNIHRIHGEWTPELAARRYAEEIRDFFGLSEGEMPAFDVVQCGMGADGHLASLFPGDPAIFDRDGIAAAIRKEKLPESRVTLLPGPLLAAWHIVFFVTGAEKAEAIRAVIEGPVDLRKYPAQLVRARRSEWFLDDAAASLLE